MAQINLFGHELALKDKTCMVNGHCESVEPYVNLYVRLTDVCNACCPFCVSKGDKHIKFDRYKFWYILQQLRKKVLIGKISFTGGEPTLLAESLSWCLRAIKDIDPDIFTVVSTNGTNFEVLEKDISYIDSIALSRHHFDDETNNGMFGFAKHIPAIQLPEYHKEKVHLSCNLVKGYIDSNIKCREYIEKMGSRGFLDIGFVSLMDVNSFCASYRLDFAQIDLKSMPDTIQSTDIHSGSCKCANFLTYLNDGTIVKSYARFVYDRCAQHYDNNLVYDENELKKGFNGVTIYN